MGPTLVSDAELCWVVAAFSPAQTPDVADVVPIKYNSVYVRLRSLKRRGYLNGDGGRKDDAADNVTTRWWLADAGDALIAEADLPPADETDFESYFSGQTKTLNRETLLQEVAAHDDEWVPSSVLYDPLPFSKYGIRKNLHALREGGLLDLDEGKNGNTHHWRITDDGRDVLAATDGSAVAHPALEQETAGRERELTDAEFLRLITTADETPTTTTAIANSCDYTRPTVYKRLQRLAEDGLIIRTTPQETQEHHWELSDAGRDRLVNDTGSSVESVQS